MDQPKVPEQSPPVTTPQGGPTREIVALCREFVRGVVRIAGHNALAESGQITIREVAIETPEGRMSVGVTVTPLDSRQPAGRILVTFGEIAELPPAGDLAVEAEIPEHYRSRAAELGRVRDELQRTIEELQTSNAQMKASNKQGAHVNEELQSTNEELETAKEELQSLNEELAAVKAQLHTKTEELEASANDLNCLLSSTNIAVIFLDPLLRIRRFTPAVKDLFDLLPADAGRPLNDFARKFKDPDLLRDAQSVLDTLVPRESEVTSETHHTYLRRLLPYRTSDNRIDGLVITFVDIGERKLAQSQLKLSQDRNSMILESIKEYAIFMLDVGGRIVAWTHGAERMFDYTAAEALGKSLDLILPAEDVATGAVEKELSTASRAGAASEDKWHVRKSGHRFWGSGALYALKNDEGEPNGFVKVLRDNTDRKQAEETLLEIKRAAEQANEAKDHFLANVSHELRTPLTAMLLWVKLLMEGETAVPAAMREGLQAIKRCAEEQQALIEDLVDTSRIAAGKLRLELRPMDLLGTIRSAVDAVSPAARSKNLLVTENYDPAVGLVQADPHRLQQVVWNLLTNAVKFTPANGDIKISTSRAEDMVTIEIQDSGQGIASEFLPHIFERFHQGENSSTRSHSGLGLGLGISRQLVELHGGTIEASSAGVGQGATFTVKLPLPAVELSENTSGPSNPRTVVDGGLKGCHILLVEDSAETRKAVTALLRSAGAEVTATENATAALAAYDQRNPELILSDIGLPDMDGNEFIRQIRQREQTNHSQQVPALAFTAFADDRNRRMALHSGFQKCMVKPINASKLVAALAKLRTGRMIKVEDEGGR